MDTDEESDAILEAEAEADDDALELPLADKAPYFRNGLRLVPKRFKETVAEYSR